MSRIENVSRRGFLKGLAGTGGLVLGMQIIPAPLRGAAAKFGTHDEQPFKPNIWLAIAESGDVTIVAHRSEMGTGSRTSLPMVVADELEADWKRVDIEQAIGDEKYGSQNTDGSRSIRNFYDTMRVAGASARQMLEAAAAKKWGVSAAECKAKNHHVVHSSGKKLKEIAHVVIDNCTPPGDAVIDIPGLKYKVSPTSTIGATAVVNALKARTAEIMVEREVEPIVLTSPHFVDNQEEAKTQLQRVYTEHNRRKHILLGRKLK